VALQERGCVALQEWGLCCTTGEGLCGTAGVELCGTTGMELCGTQRNATLKTLSAPAATYIYARQSELDAPLRAAVVSWKRTVIKVNVNSRGAASRKNWRILDCVVTRVTKSSDSMCWAGAGGKPKLQLLLGYRTRTVGYNSDQRSCAETLERARTAGRPRSKMVSR